MLDAAQKVDAAAVITVRAHPGYVHAHGGGDGDDNDDGGVMLRARLLTPCPSPDALLDSAPRRLSCTSGESTTPTPIAPTPWTLLTKGGQGGGKSVCVHVCMCMCMC